MCASQSSASPDVTVDFKKLGGNLGRGYQFVMSVWSNRTGDLYGEWLVVISANEIASITYEESNQPTLY